jgi:hypothetical protein
MTVKILQAINGDLFTVDDDDYDKVAGHNWTIIFQKNSKAVMGLTRCANGKVVRLHRLIMGLTEGDGKVVDHIDGDPTNNCKSNLRVCDQRGNRCNSGRRLNNYSGFKGVSYHKSHKSYQAVIAYNGKVKYIGTFKDPVEAAKAFNEEAIKIHGEFARLNDIYSDEIVKGKII